MMPRIHGKSKKTGPKPRVAIVGVRLGVPEYATRMDLVRAYTEGAKPTGRCGSSSYRGRALFSYSICIGLIERQSKTADLIGRPISPTTKSMLAKTNKLLRTLGYRIRTAHMLSAGTLTPA